MENQIFDLDLRPCQGMNKKKLYKKDRIIGRFLTSEIQWHVISEGLYVFRTLFAEFSRVASVPNTCRLTFSRLELAVKML